MKASRISMMVFASLLLLAATALAGSINKKTLHLYENAKVKSTLLTPGDYKVEWTGSGPNVELSIVQGRDTVATVRAQVEPENARNNSDGYVLQPAKDGGQSIKEIFFGGTKYDLKINSADKSS